MDGVIERARQAIRADLVVRSRFGSRRWGLSSAIPRLFGKPSSCEPSRSRGAEKVYHMPRTGNLFGKQVVRPTEIRRAPRSNPGAYPEVQLKKINNYLHYTARAATTQLEVPTLHRYGAALNWTTVVKRPPCSHLWG
ncbi:hypothetical protein Taro_024077 [Colocasia esculenta]|uniref:Uncharacterized protein n=1 Tax=Colocasia esculenta TaxID=4460 RepID=A0A843V8A6_COLES|nr:hypothetical protein [Colocasia esculenta]